MHGSHVAARSIALAITGPHPSMSCLASHDCASTGYTDYVFDFDPVLVGGAASQTGVQSTRGGRSTRTGLTKGHSSVGGRTAKSGSTKGGQSLHSGDRCLLCAPTLAVVLREVAVPDRLVCRRILPVGGE